MSLRHNIPEMIAEKLPQKGKRGRIDDAGLRKRPQMEQIVSYLESGQEHIAFPDRLAKLVRNHPFMTQLDFFDMQEDQERKWEEEKRQQEVVHIAEQFGMSAAAVRAMGTQGTQTDRTGTGSSGSQTDRPATSSSETQTNRPKVVGKQFASTGTDAPGATHHPIYAVHNDKHVAPAASSMQWDESDSGVPQPPSSYNRVNNPHGNPGPYRRQPPGGAPPVAIRAASQIALQDEGINASVTHMDEEARKRVTQARANEDAKKKATRQTTDVMLSSPFNERSQMEVDGGRKKLAANRSQAPVMPPDPQQATKRGPDAEPEHERVKRQVENHTKEPVQQIPYLPVSAADVMDARAQAIQNHAKVAEVQATVAATGSGDFDRLAEVVGEQAIPEAVAPANTTETFNIATPRGRPLKREKRTAPENVDSDAPAKLKVRKSARTQNNFSRQLTADEILDIKLGEKAAKTIVAKDKKDNKVKVRKTTKKDKMTADQKLDLLLGAKQSKAIVAKDKETLPKESNVPKAITDGSVSNPDKLAIGNGPKTTNAPKMSQATTEETVVSSKEMQFWQELETQQIVKKIMEEFPRHKKKETLDKMRKTTLLNYVMKLEESRNKVGQRNRSVRVK